MKPYGFSYVVLFADCLYMRMDIQLELASIEISIPAARWRVKYMCAAIAQHQSRIVCDESPRRQYEKIYSFLKYEISHFACNSAIACRS